MRKWVMMVLIMLLMTTSAYATDVIGDAAPNDPPAQTMEEDTTVDDATSSDAQVTVATFEELQAAIDAAEDEDVIMLISNGIQIPNGITLGSSDKHVVLQLAPKLADVFAFGSIFELEAGEETTTIQNVTFIGNEIQTCSIIHAWCDMQIDRCNFVDCNVTNDSSVITMYRTKTTITNSSFHNVHATNAAIAYVGEGEYLDVSNCTFDEVTGNMSDLIQNDGTTILHANNYKGNVSSGSGHMIRNRGTLYLDIDWDNYRQYYGYTPKGWYIDTLLDSSGNVILDTWEPVGSSSIDQPLCLTFDINNCIPDTDDEEQNTPEQPQEPEDQVGDSGNDDTTDEQQPQEPTQPPQDDTKDDPADDQPPKEPIDQDVDNTTDNPLDTPPDQTDADSGNHDDGDTAVDDTEDINNPNDLPPVTDEQEPPQDQFGDTDSDSV